MGPPIAAGTRPRSVTVDLSERFAYVANFASNNISAFTIDASTGGADGVGLTRLRWCGPRFLGGGSHREVHLCCKF
jgi:DNA-binding beta-propeller fold protein YncE